jgi:hypothetical protein
MSAPARTVDIVSAALGVVTCALVALVGGLGDFGNAPASSWVDALFLVAVATGVAALVTAVGAARAGAYGLGTVGAVGGLSWLALIGYITMFAD